MGIKGYRTLSQRRKDEYLAGKREYMRKWREERKAKRNHGNKQEGLNRLK